MLVYGVTGLGLAVACQAGGLPEACPEPVVLLQGPMLPLVKAAMALAASLAMVATSSGPVGAARFGKVSAPRIQQTLGSAWAVPFGAMSFPAFAISSSEREAIHITQAG